MSELKSADIRGKVSIEIKEAFTEILSQLGISPSTAISMFANQVVQEGGFPFTPKLRNPGNTLLKAMQDAELGHQLTSHSTPEELFRSWEKDNA